MLSGICNAAIALAHRGLAVFFGKKKKMHEPILEIAFSRHGGLKTTFPRR